jgi:hypothetical protein
MIGSLLEGAVGLWLVLVTLRDVFDTVIVPGRAHGLLKISRRLVLGTLPAWTRWGRNGIGVHFAPTMLLAAFVLWMLLLVLAFGLMAHALADSFSPPLKGFGQALYVAAGAMATIGIGNTDAMGPASAVVAGAGFCGLAVMTMAVTYLLEVQSNIALRDKGVLKLTTSSGQPPSAIGLLERYAALGCRAELAAVLRDARDWCAAVLQSHASHPSLVYFRSVGTGSGWPASLGAMMDVALVIEFLLEDGGLRGPAVLLREQGERLGRDVSTMVGLQPAALHATPAEVQALCSRLAAAGYALAGPAQVDRFIHVRAAACGPIEALSRHLGIPGAPLLPAPAG